MSGEDFDVIVVGSGPSGTSVAAPMAQGGLRVAMLDGGRRPQIEVPVLPFLSARQQPDQQRWMLGPQFHALRMREAVSPKLRAPTQAHVFEGFAEANRLRTDGFVAVGSLAVGGLSNAWGCGVARLSSEEAGWPLADADLDDSFRIVCERVGISGAGDDDLRDYFGVDDGADPPAALDGTNALLLQRYERRRAALHAGGFRVGRSRVAVTMRDRGDRLACDSLGNCLFGCARGSMYSAQQDLVDLVPQPGFVHRSGFIVQRLERQDSTWSVEGVQGGAPVRLRTRKVVLAAGTLATTALVARTLGHTEPVRLLCSPTAAYLLWVPARLGHGDERAFGLGQLSYALQLPSADTVFGSTFNTTGLPRWEFARHLPMSRPIGVQLLRGLLGSCAVGNVFLPGRHSDATVRLAADGTLVCTSGGPSPQQTAAFAQTRAGLARAWRRLGAVMLPGSFRAAPPGADIHYAGTLPMVDRPGPMQTSTSGEVHGLPGVHVVDGSTLPVLPAKSHTLTLMANADRIGRLIAARQA